MGRTKRNGVLVVLVLLLAAFGGSSTSAGAAATEGSVTGIVRGPGGVPVQGVSVSMESEGPPWDYGQTSTGADGRFRLDGMLAGSYIVRFNSNDSELLDEYYLDAHAYPDATPVTVIAGGTRAGVDATLEAAASMAGTVTGPAGLPLAGVGIQVEPFGTSTCCFDEYVQTSWDGTWHIEGLVPDDYVVHFQPQNGSALAPEFYDDEPLAIDATAVPVPSGADVVGIDAQLEVGATISGTVLGPTGNPLAGASVQAASSVEVFEEGGLGALSSSRLYLEPRRTTTDHLGQYTIRGLAPIEHLVAFQSYGTGLVSEWWDDVTDPADATPIPVAPVATITGIDAQLSTRGGISGTVTGLGSGPIADVWVVLYQPDGAWVSGEQTDAAGEYAFPSLNPGEYVVAFGPDPVSGWRPEFWDDARTRPEATTVVITSGVQHTGIDAELQLCGAAAMYTDVPLYQRFCSAIEWLSDSGVGGGFADGTFRPTASLSRQAVAAFLHRLTGDEPGPFPNPGFSDVSPSSPFYDDIAWLVDSGLGSGFSDGTFRPGATVSRQAMASFLYQLAGAPEWEIFDPPFADVGMAHPFLEPIAYLSQHGIIGGYRNGTFKPGDAVSRQAVASFLFAYVNNGLATTVP